MRVLTDEDRTKLYAGMTVKPMREVIDTIEAAVLKKLAALDMKPVAWNYELEDAPFKRLIELGVSSDSPLYTESQLAAAQAREQQLRETLEYFFPAWQKYEPLNWKYRARQALSQPTDTTALQALIQRAGEVMRERCAVEAWNYYMDQCKKAGISRHVFDGWCSANAIRAMPGVTLEDLR